MKIHIEIGQYQFIEADADSVETLKDIYLEVKDAFYQKDGVSDKEFNKILDEYIYEDHIKADDYSNLSAEQLHIIQAIKRSKNRKNR